MGKGAKAVMSAAVDGVTATRERDTARGAEPKALFIFQSGQGTV